MPPQWGIGAQQGPNAGQQFLMAYEHGTQRQERNALLGYQQEQQQQQRDTRDASVRAGKHVAAGDYAGAGQQAAQSGNMDLMRTIQGLSQEQRQQVAARNAAIAPLYLQARQLPYEQRRQFIASVRDRLVQQGIPAEQIDAYDPTDQRLDADIAMGMTMAQALEQNTVQWQIIPQVGAFSTRGGIPTGPLAPAQQPGQATQTPQTAPPAAPAPFQPPQAQPPVATPTAAGNGQSYTDPVYGQLEAQIGPELGVPPQVLEAIRTRGERSNAGQVSEAGARSVYQFIPETRQAFMQRYGVDAWADPQSAVRAAALHLRESYDRTGDWNQAVLEYHGGTDPRAHGPRTQAYAARVGDMSGQQTAMAGPQPGQPQASIQDQAMTGVIQAPRPVPPGFEPAPTGGIQPMRGSQPEYERQQGAQSNQRQNRNVVSGIRQEFNQLPEVRNFTTIRQAMLQIRRLATSVPQQSPERAQADMALIFSFMKALDPTSAVRETEYANAQNSAGVPDRVRNLYNRTLTGASLNPNQRRGMVSSAYQAYLASAEAYNQRAQQYHGILREAGVRNPGSQIQLATGPATEARNRQQSQQRRGRTTQGVRWRRVD